MRLHNDRVFATAGTLLFAEGEAGTVAYVIRRGRVQVFLPRPGGDLALVVRGPGELIGEMTLIDSGPRSTSARAVEDCELLVITAEQLGRRMSDSDPVLRMCVGILVDRYRQVAAMLDHDTLASRCMRPASTPNPHVAAALTTLSLESDLARAIGAGELSLEYQPIVRVADRRLAGFEALMRWHHPERGPVSPSVFIPIAEAGGLIVDLTAWCIGEVGRTFPRLRAAGRENAGAVDPLFMSVNISAHDLAQASFVADLAAMLEETGLPADAIKLEVTESVLMQEPLKAAAVLQDCRALGLKVAIDDFGTGYSSLSHLSTLPITTIKIDQTFVRSMTTDATSRKIIQMILRLAAELDIPVIAEGIEGEDEAAHLGALGCALGQGYLFGRPQPLDVTLESVRQWRLHAQASAPARPGRDVTARSLAAA